MPLSVFTGHRPADGRWTADDTALAVALHQIEALECSGCGQDRTATMNTAHEFDWQVEAVRCHACAARERYAESHMKNGGSAAGLSFVVHRKGGEDDG